MHGKYTTVAVNVELWQPGVFAHLVYRDMAGKLTERVVRVREVCADGEGFKGFCLRRIAEGGEGRRLFLFDRVIWCREWRGEAILDVDGRIVIPSKGMMRRYAAARRGVAA